MLAGPIDGASSLISGLAHVNYSTAIFYEHCACLPASLDKVNLSPGVHLLWYLLDNRCASKQPGRDEEQLQEEIIYYTI